MSASILGSICVFGTWTLRVLRRVPRKPNTPVIKEGTLNYRGASY